MNITGEELFSFSLIQLAIAVRDSLEYFVSKSNGQWHKSELFEQGAIS